jgi:hypothetical protein
MTIIQRLIFRLRAMRIDMLRSDMIAAGEAIQRLEARQFAGMHVRLARKGKMATRLRQPVPHFLRRGGAK